MPHGSEGQEGAYKQCKQDQWLPRCLQVDENSPPGENGLQHRGELCLHSAASGDRSPASENKASAQAIEACPPPHITAGSKELTVPHHARRYRSYTSLLQEKAAAERLSDPARVSAKPRRCNESPEGRAGGNGNRWRLACKRSKRSLKKEQKNWLLKDRALRITEERSTPTTDEDALSERKTGKYWNKAQRKQHLAKEQKQQKALQSQREQPSEDKASTEHRRNFAVMELSQRKQMKNRSKKILANWITIQELLTHGNRSPDGRRTYSPLLSVTAVSQPSCPFPEGRPRHQEGTCVFPKTSSVTAEQFPAMFPTSAGYRAH